MTAPKAGVAARQGGGFRQGFGHFNDEHMEQEAGASAVQQKQLTQQTAQSSQHTTGGSALQQQKQLTQQTAQSSQHATGGSALQQTNSRQTPAHQQNPPRAMGTLTEEVFKRPLQDIVKGIKSLFDIHALLGIHPEDTPEEQEKKKALHERFQQLTEEQQQVAQKLFQQKMQKEKLEEEEKQKQKEQAEAAEHQSIAPPSSPSKGPVGPGGPGGGTMSRKKMASQLLERDRQSIGRVAGAN